MTDVITLTPAQRFAKLMLKYHRNMAEVSERWDISLTSPIRRQVRDSHLCVANAYRDFGYVQYARKQDIRTVRREIERMALNESNVINDGMEATELSLISYDIYCAAVAAIDAYLDY